jgi:hypothetical protein
MNSTTSHPKKSRSSNKEANREGAKKRIAARRSYVSARSSLLQGAEPAGAAARRQRYREGTPEPIPLANLDPSLRELPRLGRETYLTPYIIAENVCREARHLTRSDVPMGYETWLVRRARQLYAVNCGFNRRLRADSGRDCLYAFLRHWITARLKREYPRLARQLPESYAIGVAPSVTL